MYVQCCVCYSVNVQFDKFCHTEQKINSKMTYIRSFWGLSPNPLGDFPPQNPWLPPLAVSLALLCPLPNENVLDPPIICPRYINVTDGQTDGRRTIAIPRFALRSSSVKTPDLKGSFLLQCYAHSHAFVGYESIQVSSICILGGLGRFLIDWLIEWRLYLCMTGTVAISVLEEEDYAPWFCSFRLWRFINHLT